jgi:hypothetical protein
VYQERLKELEMSFRDVSQDMKELMRDWL